MCTRSIAASLSLATGVVLLAPPARATPVRPETECSATIEHRAGSSQNAQLAAGEPLVVKGACHTDRYDRGQTVTEVHDAADLAVSRVRCNRLVPLTPYRKDRVLDAVTDPVPDVAFRRLEAAPPEPNALRTYRLDPPLTTGTYVVTWAGERVASFTVGAASEVTRCPELDIAVTEWSPPPPPIARNAPESPPTEHVRENWDDRQGWAWEVGAGPWLTWLSRPEPGSGLDPFAGGTLSVGLHYVTAPRHAWRSEKGGDLEVEGLRWCVPLVLCGGVGMLFAPSDTFLGNELGVDARVAVGPNLARGTLRGVLRYSRGTFRTPAFASLVVPEVGVEWRRDRGGGLVVGGSLYPVDVRLPGGFALGLDPLRIGVVFGPERRAMVEIGPELALRYAP